MANVSKSDLIDRVASAAGVDKRSAEGVLNAFVDVVKESVRGGDKVAWPAFGAFALRERPAGTARNPRTGETVQTKASKTIKFSPSSTVKDEFAGAGGSKKTAGGKKAAPARKASTKSSRPAKKASKSTKKR